MSLFAQHEPRVINYSFLFSWMIHNIIAAMARPLVDGCLVFIFNAGYFLWGILMRCASFHQHLNTHMIPVMTINVLLVYSLNDILFQATTHCRALPRLRILCNICISCVKYYLVPYMLHHHANTFSVTILYARRIILTSMHSVPNPYDILMACCASFICIKYQNHYCVMNK